MYLLIAQGSAPIRSSEGPHPPRGLRNDVAAIGWSPFRVGPMAALDDCVVSVSRRKRSSLASRSPPDLNVAAG